MAGVPPLRRVHSPNIAVEHRQKIVENFINSTSDTFTMLPKCKRAAQLPDTTCHPLIHMLNVTCDMLYLYIRVHLIDAKAQ